MSSTVMVERVVQAWVGMCDKLVQELVIGSEDVSLDPGQRFSDDDHNAVSIGIKAQIGNDRAITVGAIELTRITADKTLLQVRQDDLADVSAMAILLRFGKEGTQGIDEVRAKVPSWVSGVTVALLDRFTDLGLFE